METKLRELKTRLAEVNDLGSVISLLDWDQATNMPPGGAPARARQEGYLARLRQEKLTDPAIGRLLEELRPYEESLPYGSDEAGLIRITRRDYERAVKVPADFMEKLYSHFAKTFQAWTKARPANDFAAVQPYLEKTLELSRKYADFFHGYEHIADPLIDLADPGMTAATVSALFSELRKQLVPLADSITSQPVLDDACLYQVYPDAQQSAFINQIIRCLGFDFERGRIDRSHHPFMIKFSLGDIRITTRVREDFLGEALFSTIHESGHAMYEQGIRLDFEATPLAQGTSAGIHESQSRLWENMVGRSRPFWEYFYPQLQKVFPGQLGSTSLETFYAAINKVERSLIRTDADEVTYDLHVMLRFDLELALLEGTLAIQDLPEAWNARFQSDLGLVPPDHRYGVLQDMHWFSGPIGGAFQGYSLGNILGAQIFSAAVRANPGIPAEIESGDFGTLRGWLAENIYQHGRKYTAPELIERITGKPVSIKPYIRYLREKFGGLYTLS
jgi:carboxypeptidase Taq